MKMKKYILLLALTPILFGCNSFLDVNPKSEVTNDDMFASAEGCEDALYGVYAHIGYKQNLFGEKLSFRVAEAMTCNTTERDAAMKYFTNRVYDINEAEPQNKDIWTELYEAIGYTNNIIQNLDKQPEGRYRFSKLYKGEAYALRAFLHMTVAQYYAAPYATNVASAKAKAIPYVKTYDKTITGFSTLAETYQQILEDLLYAEKLLYQDEALMPAIRNNAATGFTEPRITHLNLYAVQALIARSYWLMGNLTDAEIYALKVINSQKFPLLTSVDFISFEGGVLDLKETIFGLYSTQTSKYYYKAHLDKTPPGISIPSDLDELYAVESVDGSDNRLKSWFQIENDRCMKLHNNVNVGTDGQDATYKGKSILGFSIVRIPEMYYIVAETNLTKDPVKAMRYFDDVIESRGMVRYADRLNAGPITEDMLFNERRREFYMEGFLFIDMKRLQKDITLEGNIVLNGKDIPTYTISILPSCEDKYRD